MKLEMSKELAKHRVNQAKDNIEEAEIFTDLSEARQLCKDLLMERNTKYEIIRFSQTTWLDKCFILRDNETDIYVDDHKCCCERDCCQKAEQDIDDFGIKNVSLDEAAKQQQTMNEIISQLGHSVDDKSDK